MSQINPSTDQLQNIIKPYFSQDQHHRSYFALIFEQGKRTMLQINVPACELGNLLQAKPSTRNDPNSGKHRGEIKGHSEAIKQYILDKAKEDKPWILGIITVNIAPELISIIELKKGLCIVIIPNGTKFDLTDGYHRTISIEHLTQSSHVLNNDYIPLLVILEDNFKQCQLDFRDLAQSKPVGQALLLSFSECTGIYGITQSLIETVSIFNGKTDKIKKSPSKKEKLIYTTKYIATMVSCALTDNPNEELQGYDAKKYANILTKSLNHFFEECIQTQHISKIPVEKLSLQEIVYFKEECLLGVSIGLQILGKLLYCTYDHQTNQFNTIKISELAKIDWSRDNQLWHGNVIRVKSSSQNSNKTNISYGASAISDAVKATKIRLGWI